MKKALFVFIFCIFSFFARTQTAVNFNCNDCAGNNHDLFTELNAGKVVVICWVMPCATCISGALAAQAACSNYAGSNPGQVLYYIADDLGSTSCSTLLSWCNTNGITPNAIFSNPAINMLDYGSTGMPKVVVLGGANHTVYYNQINNSISTSGIHNAIGTALAAIANGIDQPVPVIKEASIYPNPTQGDFVLNIDCIDNYDYALVEIFSVTGQKAAEFKYPDLMAGKNKINLVTNGLENGVYYVNLVVGADVKKLKLSVVR